MPSPSRAIMCAAGGGKTTRIVGEAFEDADSRIALITYTKNNEQEIKSKLYRKAPAIPSRIEVITWYAFLLRELARPYRPALHHRRIDNICWVKGISDRFAKESNTARHYFADGRHVYSDKISKFICSCDRRSNGAVMRRLAQRFDHIFIDEVQDLAGYDLEVLELILRAGIKLTLVGDHRQATFQTNHAKKNSRFAKTHIIRKLKEWHDKGLCPLSYERHTHRCIQPIADLGDSFFPNDERTTSKNDDRTGHDGVFIVPTARVASYAHAFAPQVLRLDKTTTCHDYPAMNFGESKGRTFDRVLIFPHKLARKWLDTGQLKHIEKSVAKMYVGVTRARYSVAFVFDGEAFIPDVQVYAE